MYCVIISPHPKLQRDLWSEDWDLVFRVTTTDSRYLSSSILKPKEARITRINVKTLLKIFSNYKNSVHRVYTPSGRTLKKYNKGVLRSLRDVVLREKKQLSGECQPALQRRLCSTFWPRTTFPTSNNHHIPQISPFGICSSFQKSKLIWNEIKYLQENATSQQHVIKKELGECFHRGKRYWMKFVDSEVGYFEGY